VEDSVLNGIGDEAGKEKELELEISLFDRFNPSSTLSIELKLN
jgi:hypothetical protein